MNCSPANGPSSPRDTQSGWPRRFTLPSGDPSRWIQTLPTRGWCIYIRICGPDQAAFDGTWKPEDVAVAL
jgi:hypothetical protein